MALPCGRVELSVRWSLRSSVRTAVLRSRNPEEHLPKAPKRLVEVLGLFAVYIASWERVPRVVTGPQAP